jgi:hypothetical protein
LVQVEEIRLPVVDICGHLADDLHDVPLRDRLQVERLQLVHRRLPHLTRNRASDQDISGEFAYKLIDCSDGSWPIGRRRTR